MNHWPIQKITDKNKFLSALILSVPKGSLWQADGINSVQITEFLKPYLTKKCQKQWEVLGNSEKDFFELELSDQNKALISQEVLRWDLEKNLQDQSITFEGKDYFKSYDHLNESCTWISKSVNLDMLVKEGMIQLEE